MSALSLVQWRQFLFHITHQDNVPAILARGIYSKNEARRRNVKYRSIADEGIQERRSATTVPVGKDGTVHDYVPLFFAARPPMLLAVQYRFPKEEIFYIVAQWRAIDLPHTVFTDGNASTGGTEFLCESKDLAKIDRDALAAYRWEAPEVRRKKAAEVLVWKHLPIDYIQGIIVLNDAAKARAEEMVAARKLKLSVRIAREYYYV